MIGFILAAGMGTRLRPLTSNIPKALVPVCGVPLLQIATGKLKKSGCDTLGANTHYLASLINDFNSKEKLELNLFNEENKIRGTGGALFFAKDFLSTQDSFCVYNVDIVSNINLKNIFDKFANLDCDCALVSVPTSGKGSILTDTNNSNYLGTVYNKNINQSNSVAVDFIGITLYRKSFLKNILEDDFSIVPVWDRLIKYNGKVKVILENNITWYDTGTAKDFANVHMEVINGTSLLDTPNWITLDKNKKIAYNNKINLKEYNSIGKYSWIASSNLPQNISTKNCVILEDANLHNRKIIESEIIFKNGSLSFE